MLEISPVGWGFPSTLEYRRSCHLPKEPHHPYDLHVSWGICRAAFSRSSPNHLLWEMGGPRAFTSVRSRSPGKCREDALFAHWWAAVFCRVSPIKGGEGWIPGPLTSWILRRSPAAPCSPDEPGPPAQQAPASHLCQGRSSLNPLPVSFSLAPPLFPPTQSLLHFCCNRVPFKSSCGSTFLDNSN